jgi:hypothetical protein
MRFAIEWDTRREQLQTDGLQVNALEQAGTERAANDDATTDDPPNQVFQFNRQGAWDSQPANLFSCVRVFATVVARPRRVFVAS